MAKVVPQRCNVGIDVSKDTLEVVFAERFPDRSRVKGRRKFNNTSKGHRALLTWINKKHKHSELPLHFTMEATGVYYEELAYFLHDHGHIVHVELPNTTKAYAKSWNQKSKTDKIDARLLAYLGLERELRRWMPPSWNMLPIKRLCRERIRVLKDKTRLLNQLHAQKHAHQANRTTIKRLKQHIKLLEKQLKAIEEELQQMVQQDEQLNERIEQICTIKGVRLITAITIIAETNGFALITSRAQLVSYVGYDVVHNESGSSLKGKTRISKKGNRYIRRALHWPAISAVKHEPIFKEFYQRVLEKSNIKMKAYVAVQRKLLVTIYALYKNKTAFDPEYTQKQSIQKSRQDTMPAYTG